VLRDGGPNFVAWCLRLAALAAFAFSLSACAGGVTPEVAIEQSDQPSLVVSDAPLECAAYARERSGIELHGDAYTWWDQAEGRYARVASPQSGAILVLAGYAGPKHGHLAVVTKLVSPREIRVDHANWLNDGNLYLNTPVIDVSPDNNWTEVRIWNTPEHHLGGNTYMVQGFILPDTTSASVDSATF
jgi:surface antigen